MNTAREEYREQRRQSESWPTADGLVWWPARQAAAGMPTASCRRMTAVPARTDCCENRPTTAPSHAAAVPGRAAGTSSDHTIITSRPFIDFVHFLIMNARISLHAKWDFSAAQEQFWHYALPDAIKTY